MSDKRFTVIIPTRNRPLRLARQLRFYRDQGCTFPLIVADSSDVPATTEDYHGRILRFPADTSLPDKIRDAAKIVDTPYAVVGGDDDFFIPEALDEAVEWLSSHSDYSMVYGHSTTFVSDGKVEQQPHNIQFSLELETAEQRLRAGFGIISDWHAMKSTELVYKSFDLIGRHGVDLDLMFEHVPHILAIGKGKGRCLDRLWMARERQQKRQPWGEIRGPRDFMSRPDAEEQLQLLVKIAADEGIEAREVVDRIRRHTAYYPPGVIASDEDFAPLVPYIDPTYVFE